MNTARGMTIVELLVGLTVALFLLAGAAALMTQQLHEHRRLLLESQLQADARALQVLMRRELRQAGVWGAPAAAVWQPGRAAPRANPYDAIEIQAGELRFAASQAVTDPPQTENQQLDLGDQKALRWRGSTLEFRTDGGRFQPLNDPTVVAVQRFEATLHSAQHDAESQCAQACGGQAQCPPRVTVRTLRIRLALASANDPSIRQDLDWQLPIDSPRVEGQCPL